MTLDKDWPDLVTEETLEPERPICDPHHHFWVLREAPFNRDPRYLLDELIADVGGGHNIVSTVFIECRAMYRAEGPEAMKPVGETEFINGLAAMSASGHFGKMRAAAGIVGHTNLLLGDGARAVLEAHVAAGNGRFRGIRHAAGWDASAQVRNSYTDPKPQLYLDATFRQGFRHLAPLGLSFEAWLYHPQLDDVTDLARAFPETTVILNHLGGPLGIGPYAGKRDQVFEIWRQKMSELAGCPNVVVKLGGIQMDINGFNWHGRARPPASEELARATAPYYRHAIERFGVERCMFESNFPVDKLSCGYNVLWNAFKRIAAGATEGEKANLFHDTAARVYRLQTSPAGQ